FVLLSVQISHAHPDLRSFPTRRSSDLGYEQMSGFQRVFEDDGGKVVKKLWPPLVTPDYTPYIAQIGNVDCVFNGFAGSNPVKFRSEEHTSELQSRFDLVCRLLLEKKKQ